MKNNIKKGAAEFMAVVIILVVAGVLSVTIMTRKTREADAVNKVVQSQITSITI